MKYLSPFVIFSLLALVLPIDTAQAQDITSGIVSCWDLEEQTGARIDSVSANNLTDINTVGSGPGKVGNAASFINSNQERLFVETTDFEMSNGDFSLGLWVRFDSTDVSRAVISKGQYDPAIREMMIYNRGALTGLTFVMSNSGISYDVILSSNMLPNVGNWQFIFVKHDDLADQVYFRIDENPPWTAPFTAGITGGNEFYIGAFHGYTFHLEGDVDSVMYWDRPLSDEEIELVYNAGLGIGCDDVIPVANGANATQIEINLPSGGRGILTYEMSAGEALVVLSVSVGVMLKLYSMLSTLARGAKIK